MDPKAWVERISVTWHCMAIPHMTLSVGMGADPEGVGVLMVVLPGRDKSWGGIMPSEQSEHGGARRTL